MNNSRREYYDAIFKNCDENELQLASQLIDEVIFYEKRMDELKRLPFIAVNPKNQAMQKTTAAAKLYKDLMAQYMNAVRILINILRKNDTSAADRLLEQLEEFM